MDIFNLSYIEKKTPVIMIQGGFMLLPPSKHDISQTSWLSAFVYVPLLPFRATRIKLRRAAQIPYNMCILSVAIKKKKKKAI